MCRYHLKLFILPIRRIFNNSSVTCNIIIDSNNVKLTFRSQNAELQPIA